MRHGSAMQRERSGRQLLLVLGLALPLCLLLSVSLGSAPITLAQAGRILLALLGADMGEIDQRQQLILYSLRLPRALLAALVGAALAVCGAAMQGLFRNPLADPALIGVSSGASVGAATAIVLGSSMLGGIGAWLGAASPWLGSLAVMGCAFLGGFVTTLLVYRLGTNSSGTSIATMLLAGIAINALAGGVSNLFSYIADDQMLRRLSLWKMGSLAGISWRELVCAALILAAVSWSLCRYSAALNALLLGESEARHLGIAVERVKRRLILLSALGVGVAVSLSGMIGFVGLVVPHLVRLMIGPDHRFLLPAAMLLGALLLMLADIVARLAIAPQELPIGIVTALLGAPFFISLLIQQRRRMVLN